MKVVFSLFLSHIRIFKERSDKSQKSTFIKECSFLSSDQEQRLGPYKALIVFNNESSNSCGSSSAG
ncbi:hypothetical protein CR512_00690 [Pseudomonas putida]|nr:hypothetical protein CR512_00690 [Pseudomonas putida]